jgi:5'-3' exonuclease
MEKTLAIIDGDSLCYLCSKDTLKESTDNIDNLLQKILTKTGSTSYYLFLSEGKYFRHSINEHYKGKRTASSLKYLKTLKKYLVEQYYAEAWKNVEADDCVTYVQQLFLSGKLPEFTKTVVCAIDKDIKKQIAGEMYDYRTDTFTVTTSDEAEKFLHIQSIMGDSTDNITGIPGIGEVKATKLLENIPIKECCIEAYRAYCKHYSTPSEALQAYQENFRQVYLLRTDADFMYEVKYIPKLNSPITIINE